MNVGWNGVGFETGWPFGCLPDGGYYLKNLQLISFTYFRFYQWIRKPFLINPNHPYTQNALKSKTIINRELSRQLITTKFIIHPFSSFNLIWEVIMTIIYFIAFIVHPFEIFYLNKAHNTLTISTSEYLIDLVDLICIIDVLLKFSTGIYDKNKNQIFLNWRIIWITYLKFYFWIDALSSIPTTFLIHSEILDKSYLICFGKDKLYFSCLWDVVSLLSSLKLMRLSTFLEYLNKILTERFTIKKYSMKLIKVVLVLLFLLHWISCLEMTVVRFALFETDLNLRIRSSWNDWEEFWLSSPIEKYLHCFYRSTFDICLFGHFTRNNLNYEDMLLEIFLTFVGFYLKAYLLAQIIMFVRNVYSASVKFHQSRYQLQAFMRHQQLRSVFQKKLLNYYDYTHQKKYYKELEIFQLLGKQLKFEIIEYTCSQLIESVHLFSSIPKEILKELIKSLRSEIYLKNDLIVNSGSTGETMYFICTGTVAVYTSTGREVVHLEDGAHFGEIALLLENETRSANVVAVEICELFALDRSDFMKLLLPFPILLRKVTKLAKVFFVFIYAFNYRKIFCF